MRFLKQMFTWWNGATWNTRFYTWRKGEFMGQDALGNKYYRGKSAMPDSIPERRWVIYQGYSEASQIPPGWHGWMHHRTDITPGQESYKAFEWEKPHQENLTGSARAYHPPGSIATGSKPAPRPVDYQAWTPK